MKRPVLILHHIALITLFLLTPFYAFANATIVKLGPTGPQPTIVSPQGRTHTLYVQSHALLISSSDYLGESKQGWRKLPNTEREMDALAKVLQPHGFHIWRVSNPTGIELVEITRDFMARFGHHPDNRILFFFSGHGYTNLQTDFGYLVPIDAKDPTKDRAGFYNKAIPITEIEVAAKGIEARHAIFFFDSCFSGTIFAGRSEPNKAAARGTSASERWKFLTGEAAEPVRQFVAAGGAKQELPAQSQFVPLLINALKFGNASSIKDGYVTGKEIGTWISQVLPGPGEEQTPHSDVLRDPRYIFGDMVFQLPDTSTKPITFQAVTPQVQPRTAEKRVMEESVSTNERIASPIPTVSTAEKPPFILKWIKKIVQRGAPVHFYKLIASSDGASVAGLTNDTIFFFNRHGEIKNKKTIRHDPSTSLDIMYSYDDRFLYSGVNTSASEKQNKEGFFWNGYIYRFNAATGEPMGQALVSYGQPVLGLAGSTPKEIYYFNNSGISSVKITEAWNGKKPGKYAPGQSFWDYMCLDDGVFIAELNNENYYLDSGERKSIPIEKNIVPFYYGDKSCLVVPRPFTPGKVVEVLKQIPELKGSTEIVFSTSVSDYVIASGGGFPQPPSVHWLSLTKPSNRGVIFDGTLKQEVQVAPLKDGKGFYVYIGTGPKDGVWHQAVDSELRFYELDPISNRQNNLSGSISADHLE